VGGAHSAAVAVLAAADLAAVAASEAATAANRFGAARISAKLKVKMAVRKLNFLAEKSFGYVPPETNQAAARFYP
jgi:hypothetical protein